MTHPLALLFALVPSVVWIGIWFWVRDRGLPLRWLVIGMIAGALVGVPVWFAESWVDQFSTGERITRDIVQQVVGAACCEEVIKFAAVLTLLMWWRRSVASARDDSVAIALSVGLGFMTLENLIAVSATDDPVRLAFSRQVTILAGHPSFQVVMGAMLARWFATRSRIWWVAAIVLPIVLHGWCDLAEALFDDEPNLRSTADTYEFQAWIIGVFVTLASAVACIWKRPASPP